MANKQINDLQLRSDFDGTCNVPVDDASQTWRATGAQILAYIGAAAGLITDRTALTTPAGDDLISISDTSASAAIKKITKSNFMKRSIVAKTTTYTATVDDDVITVSAASAWTLTLPTAVGIGGKEFWIMRTDTAPDQAVTIDANGSETIGGALTQGLYTPGEAWHIVSDNANWQVINHKTETGWIAYTPTFTGMGTVASIDMWWRRVGDAMDIRGRWTSGTPTAVEARMSTPFSLASHATKISQITGVGTFDRNVANALKYITLIESNVAYLTMSKNDGSNGANVHLTKKLGSDLFSNGEVVPWKSEGIPIAGWTA